MKIIYTTIQKFEVDKQKYFEIFKKFKITVFFLNWQFIPVMQS